MSGRHWSEAEDRVILANRGKRYKEICKLINEMPEVKGYMRTPNAAHERMRRLANKLNLPMKGKADIVRDDKEAMWSQRIVDMNENFVKAMLKAGYLPCVVQDDSPLVVRRCYPVGVVFTQSIGGECADRGAKTRDVHLEEVAHGEED